MKKIAIEMTLKINKIGLHKKIRLKRLNIKHNINNDFKNIL